MTNWMYSYQQINNIPQVFQIFDFMQKVSPSNVRLLRYLPYLTSWYSHKNFCKKEKLKANWKKIKIIQSA